MSTQAPTPARYGELHPARPSRPFARHPRHDCDPSCLIPQADELLAWLRSFTDGSLLPSVRSEPVPGYTQLMPFEREKVRLRPPAAG
jgi:hypothetical protein